MGDKLKVEIQKLIVVAVAILALALIVKNQFSDAMILAVGLVGFISQTTLSDRQSKMIDEFTQEMVDDKL